MGTSLKHFAANNQETERFRIDAVVDERTLREIYLPAFETAVKKAKPWTVMCAYNKLNGAYCSENHRLLVEILKDEWGFDGLVVSDWGAVHDRVAALQGGLDLEMPGPQARRTQAVVDAVKAGALRRGRARRSSAPYPWHHFQGGRDAERRRIRCGCPSRVRPSRRRRRDRPAEEQRHPASAETPQHRRDRSFGQRAALPGRRQLAHQPDAGGHPLRRGAEAGG